MKKAYMKPSIDISVFDTEDIITVSGTGAGLTNDGELKDSDFDVDYGDLFK